MPERIIRSIEVFFGGGNSLQAAVGGNVYVCSGQGIRHNSKWGVTEIRMTESHTAFPEFDIILKDGRETVVSGGGYVVEREKQDARLEANGNNTSITFSQDGLEALQSTLSHGIKAHSERIESGEFNEQEVALHSRIIGMSVKIMEKVRGRLLYLSENNIAGGEQ